MKKCSLLLIVFSFLFILTSFRQLNAQEKSKEEQEKELQIQRTIDQQKKVMAEQKKAHEIESKVLVEQQVELNEALKEGMVDLEGALDEAFENIQLDIENIGEDGHGIRIYSKKGPGNKISRFEEPFIVSPASPGFYSHSTNGSSERTIWDLSRSVRESTFSKDYTFDVEKSIKNIVMSVSGDCRAGEIRIKVIMPGGKSYSDIVIDEFGNLNWRKSFTISENENQDKTGTWKFQVSTTKATGYFKISLQTV